MRTDESLERDGRPDERRIGRLEAVALQGPQNLNSIVASVCALDIPYVLMLSLIHI